LFKKLNVSRSKDSNRKFFSELIILVVITLIPFILIKSDLFVITTPSMVPTLNVGDIIIRGNVLPEDIEVGEKDGDILILKGPQYYYEHGFDPFFWNYLEENTPIIHRAIDKKKIGDKWYFLTKGDNNWVADGGFKLLNDTNDYVLIEYNSSRAIYISETEILGKVIFKILFVGYLNMIFPLFLISLISIIIVLVILKKALKYKIKFVKVNDST